MKTSVPQLLPSWHDVSLQDLVRQKGKFRFTQLNPPDYGGMSVDVDINAKVYCKVPKYYKSQIRFASDKCALPFWPLKKIDSWTDPCLESLKKEKIEFDKFSLKLSRAKINTTKAFHSKLKNLQQQIKTFNCENQDEEINIEVPNSIVHLANTIPKRVVVPTFNVDYAGGTLAVCKSSGKQFFLHPKFEDLNKLCITPLLDGRDMHFTPDLSEQKIIDLEEEPILQVENALDGFCVRQKNSFHLVNTTDLHLNIYSKRVRKPALYHIAASPYNPMEILSVYEKGMMKLKNMVTGTTVWSVSDDVYYNQYLLYPTWRCGFGSHAFSSLCLNERNLYSFDFREKCNSAKVIFTTENSSFYVGEELIGLKQWNKNPFQHLLTSSHHLIICDERYPKTPVMYWNHCLKNPPLYLECADFDSNVSIIVIGTQKSPQLASFLCSHQTDVQPVSLSSPLLLSSPNDCIDSLKFHCHYIDDKVSSRFSCPLTGVCVIPHNTEIGFTVLQSTSLGDVFYQDFKQSSEAVERTYHVSTGCVLTPPEKILPHLNELILNGDSDEEPESTDEGLTHIQINIDKILCSPKEISSNCMFCRICNESKDKELILSEICPTCSLSSAESQHLSKAVANESVLIGPTSEESGFLDCDIEYLSKFDDKYSKRILSVWLESDDVEESQGTDTQNMSLP